MKELIVISSKKYKNTVWFLVTTIVFTLTGIFLFYRIKYMQDLDGVSLDILVLTATSMLIFNLHGLVYKDWELVALADLAEGNHNRHIVASLVYMLLAVLLLFTAAALFDSLKATLLAVWVTILFGLKVSLNNLVYNIVTKLHNSCRK